MRRVRLAILGMAFAFGLSGGAVSAASGSLFAGAWTSTDISDGSTQYLLISAESAPHVTLVDLYARYCERNGAVSTVFTGSGQAVVAGVTLDVTMDRAACGSYQVDKTLFVGLRYVYAQASDTVADSYGNTWRRVPAAIPGTRTVSVAPFAVRWDSSDPEAITALTWNGSPNLTNTAPHPNCPEGGLSEFWGDSWGTGDNQGFFSLVGWGTSGIWAPHGTNGVDILSVATGCYGDSGIPVQTRYRFLGGAPTVARIQVERRFEFGVTPFTNDIRPYIPRLSIANDYSQVLYPSITGSLVTRNALDCHFGCPVLDWNGTWFAIHDPSSGRGAVVRHEAASTLADLWIDVDAYSTSTSSSILLRAPTGGFTGTLVDREVVCFYDASIWTPAMAPPAACTRPWTETPVAIGSKLGLSSSSGTYGASTKTASLGGYVSWRGNLGLAAAGQSIGVYVATRNVDGTWSPFSRLTARKADASGAVTFNWRQTNPKWVSVRFIGAGVTTTAGQARWR